MTKEELDELERNWRAGYEVSLTAVLATARRALELEVENGRLHGENVLVRMQLGDTRADNERLTAQIKEL